MREGKKCTEKGKGKGKGKREGKKGREKGKGKKDGQIVINGVPGGPPWPEFGMHVTTIPPKMF